VHRAFCTLALIFVFGCQKAPPPVIGELVDDAGVRLTLAAPPARVVSLIPATTELVFALGAGPLLVGRTTWCDYPAEASVVPNLGNGIDPNVEAVVAANPGLVLLYKSGANRAAAERFRALGIPTLELATDRMEDFDRITRLVGAALGRGEEAESLVVRTARDLESASRPSVRLSDRPSVFILVWDRPPMTLGRGSFLSEILERAGARNLFDDLATSSAPVSIEVVAARDPDYVLISSIGEPAIAGRTEWQVVRAVRDRKFLRVRGSEFNRPSPRIGAAVRQLAAALDSLSR
jgi:iron complex transport system substrate-binding protein